MKKKLILTALLALQIAISGTAAAEDEKFNIRRFDVQGNTLLPQETVNRLVAPYTGDGRVYGDVQKALAKRLNPNPAGLGFHTIFQVFVPEQELTAGEVRLNVIETLSGRSR